MTTLWELPEHQTAKVLALESRLEERHRIRMVELGLRPGEQVQALKHIVFGGPRLYRIGGSVYSIAHEIASLISVIELNGAESAPPSHP